VTLELRFELAISRPPEDVFAFLTDTANFPVVDRALIDYAPRGRLSLGLTGTFSHRRGAMTARTKWRVDEYEAPTRLRVSVQGMGYAMDETAELVAVDGGTRVTFHERVWPTSLAGRLLVALSGGIMRRDLAKRSALLEAALGGRS
jgi:uncharacterized protein YndB with AHSA1/START domain